MLKRNSFEVAIKYSSKAFISGSLLAGLLVRRSSTELTMPIPKFATLRADIDPKLEAIIQKALQRDRDKRYQSAAEMMTDLELYLYSDRYGPTNEKLGALSDASLD